MVFEYGRNGMLKGANARFPPNECMQYALYALEQGIEYKNV